jgi:hypothetical protein
MKGTQILWNSKSIMNYFGDTLIIEKGEAGKIIWEEPNPDQYLVEFQNVRFYAILNKEFTLK